MTWIRAHFQRYRQRKPWDFCWRISIEGLLVALVFAIPLMFLGLSLREIKVSFPILLFSAVVVAPVLETFIFQAFPVWIARLCKARFSVQVAASVIPFFLAHATIAGVGSGIAAGLISGFYLAFTYVHWREQKRWTAFWTTAVSHAIHNGILMILLAFVPEEIGSHGRPPVP